MDDADRHAEAAAAEFDEAQAPVLRDLAAAGTTVDSVDHLTDRADDAARGVLLDHLRRTSHPTRLRQALRCPARARRQKREKTGRSSTRG